jgi:hypothetical protein
MATTAQPQPQRCLAISNLPPVYESVEALRAASNFGEFGGRYIPETLVAAHEELERVYVECTQDPAFHAELDRLGRDYIGRPTPLYHAQRLSDAVGGAAIWFKREELTAQVLQWTEEALLMAAYEEELESHYTSTRALLISLQKSLSFDKVQAAHSHWAKGLERHDVFGWQPSPGQQYYDKMAALASLSAQSPAKAAAAGGGGGGGGGGDSSASAPSDAAGKPVRSIDLLAQRLTALRASSGAVAGNTVPFTASASHAGAPSELQAKVDKEVASISVIYLYTYCI